MKVQMIKQPGGGLLPAFDTEEERMKRFKSYEQYEIDIKLQRNPKFHRLVFEFFNYCFNYWRSDREFMDEAGQFDIFRKHLTVLAGYYDEYYTIKGEVRIEAKSLSYANMEQEDFERCYQALIQAAIRNIFVGCDDEETYKTLCQFF